MQHVFQNNELTKRNLKILTKMTMYKMYQKFDCLKFTRLKLIVIYICIDGCDIT